MHTNNPISSVYRLQLNQEFSLKKAINFLPYLKELGVDGIYLSPYFDAYSAHGYDVTDPNQLNPQIGTPEEFTRFCNQLKKLKIAHIMDVVPNHMGIKGGKNRWWQDVLTYGPDSKYAHFFDIDFSSDNKVVLPILADPDVKPVQKGESLYYGDWVLPEKQEHYQLIDWRLADQKINYRRFFDINELVAVRIEQEDVLQAHHKWVFELLKSGQVEGVRVDHPDGLYDPAAYFKRLKEQTDGIVIIEKILERQESLPKNWQVDGTVGYEYLNVVNGLFVRKKNKAKMTRLYEQFIGKQVDFSEILYQSKKLYTSRYMASEVNALGRMIAEQGGLPLQEVIEGIQELICNFPVYRTYISPEGLLSKADTDTLKRAIEGAKARLKSTVYDFFESIFLDPREAYLPFILKFQQVTGPVMAKGMEDTAFYIYNRLISLNEVGGDPTYFGHSISDFHRCNREKLAHWPQGFLPASTHDTKRSEDVRMRINVLSEMPQKYKQAIKKWQKLNKEYNKEGGIDSNTEYYLYQTLIGIWPTQLPKDPKPFYERVWQCLLKSVREAKQKSDWRDPDLAFESAYKRFFYAIVVHAPFLDAFTQFHKQIDHYGALNSLSATILRFGSCGVFELYQGNEIYKYSLVDPDNRGSIDVDLLRKSLTQKQVKIDLHYKLLNFRREHPELFLQGSYIPLKVVGPKKDHVVAFMRKHQKKCVVVVAARFLSELENNWAETKVILPKMQADSLHDLLHGSCLKTEASLACEALFKSLPVSCLCGI